MDYGFEVEEDGKEDATGVTSFILTKNTDLMAANAYC